MQTISPAARIGTLGRKVETIGFAVLRYGLVVVIGWIGAMKYTAVEANGIVPVVSHSPLMGWMYHYLSVRHFSDGLGTVELAVALLIASRFFSARLCAAGSAIAILMFCTTLSFLFSTPGWDPGLGFPALSGDVGDFVLKDLVLLGASVWSLGESLTAVSRKIAEKPGAPILDKAARHAAALEAAA